MPPPRAPVPEMVVVVDDTCTCYFASTHVSYHMQVTPEAVINVVFRRRLGPLCSQIVDLCLVFEEEGLYSAHFGDRATELINSKEPRSQC